MNDIAAESVLPTGRRRKEIPSQEFLRECFDYRDGELFWRVRPRSHFRSDKGWHCINGRDAGKKAGNLKANGTYFEVKIGNYGCYYLHRIVWAWHYGPFDPSLEIDHRDENKRNNRIENLRICSASENMYNRASTKKKKSGLPKGVCRKGRKFMAELKLNKRRLYLGTFDTPEKASNAYQKKANELHGEFARF